MLEETLLILNVSHIISFIAEQLFGLLLDKKALDDFLVCTDSLADLSFKHQLIGLTNCIYHLLIYFKLLHISQTIRDSIVISFSSSSMH
jgi:hypothetical protein